MPASSMTLAALSAVLAIARAWIGTPYLHKAAIQGVGSDCLGLARSIWRALHGNEPWEVPPSSRDGGEAGVRKVLLDAAHAFLIEIPLADSGHGSLILFRMGAGAPAKHCGVLDDSMIRPTLIHAMTARAWSRRPSAPPGRA